MGARLVFHPNRNGESRSPSQVVLPQIQVPITRHPQEYSVRRELWPVAVGCWNPSIRSDKYRGIPTIMNGRWGKNHYY